MLLSIVRCKKCFREIFIRETINIKTTMTTLACMITSSRHWRAVPHDVSMTTMVWSSSTLQHFQHNDDSVNGTTTSMALLSQRHILPNHI